jgi:pSer/pThr/pTyr-binding forkhead associated (FHA) protein
LESLVIRLTNSDTRPVFQVDVPSEEGYVLGRSDESSDFIPDIDLVIYGAHEKGISRRHVAIVRFHGQPHLLDLTSVNGTFLNGKRLLADVPYPLEEHNQVRLGTLHLTISKTAS